MDCFHCGRLRFRAREMVCLVAIAAIGSAWIELWKLAVTARERAELREQVDLTHCGLLLE